MSTPSFDDPTRQQPQDDTSHSRHGSVGPAIGALAVIMVLAAIAVVIGRFCSGRKIMGRRLYDFEGWVETKCSSCIDGRLGPPPPPCMAMPAAMVESSEGGSATGGVPPHEEEIHHNLQEVAMEI